MTMTVSNRPALWRRSSTGETARVAAQSGDKPTLRQRVLDEIEASSDPLIPEQILERLQRQGVRTVLTSIRPRCSELMRLGLIVDSGVRLRGEGGCKAIAWRCTTPAEQSHFLARKAAEDEEGPQHAG